MLLCPILTINMCQKILNNSNFCAKNDPQSYILKEFQIDFTFAKKRSFSGKKIHFSKGFPAKVCT